MLYASHKEYKKVQCWNKLNLVETEDQSLNIDKCKAFLKKVLLNTSSGFFKWNIMKEMVQPFNNFIMGLFVMFTFT